MAKTTQGESLDHEWPIPEDKLRRKLSVPSQGRLYYIRYALKMGWTIDQIHELTNIDPWFLVEMKQLTDFEDELIASRKLLAAVGKADPDDRPTQVSPPARHPAQSEAVGLL